MRRSDALKLAAGQRIGCRWPGRNILIPLTVVSVCEDSTKTPPELFVMAQNAKGKVDQYNHKLLAILPEESDLTS